jgi:hypothetical protein
MVMAAWVQTIVLAVTAWFVWRYTKETANLGRAMVRQNEISLRPVVVPTFDTSPEGLVCILTNIGAGAALNVRVEPLEIDRWEEVVHYIRFIPVGYLASGKSSRIDFERFANEQRDPGPDPAFRSFLPEHGQKERTMKVLFENVEGTKYEHPIKLTPPSDKFAGNQNVDLLGIRKL